MTIDQALSETGYSAPRTAVQVDECWHWVKHSQLPYLLTHCGQLLNLEQQPYQLELEAAEGRVAFSPERVCKRCHKRQPFLHRTKPGGDAAQAARPGQEAGQPQVKGQVDTQDG